jgi:hypothetical protein
MTEKVVFQKLDGTVEIRNMNDEEKAVQEQFKQNVINRNKAVDDFKSLKKSAIDKLKGATYSALTDAEAKALFGE